MATSPWEALASEICRLICEQTLRFERPIKKFPITISLVSVAADHLLLRPINPQFSLLFVNKQTFSEALPILYQDNTISIHQITVHDLTRPLRRLQTDNIRSLKIHLSHHDLWACRHYSGAITDIVSSLNSKDFSRLGSAVFSFDHETCWIIREQRIHRKELQRRGMKADFAGVGRLTIAGLREGLKVVSEHQALAMAWQYISTLSPAELTLLCGKLRQGSQGQATLVLKKICALFLDHHGLSPRAMFGRVERSTVDLEWLSVENQTAQILEHITTALEVYAILTGGYTFR